jgi:hypothetical protein
MRRSNQSKGASMNAKEELTKLLMESYDRGVEDAKQAAIESLAQVVALEREACARLCEELAAERPTTGAGKLIAQECAAAIRARGQEMERKPANANDKAYSEVELANAYQKGWDDAMLRRSIGARSQA